MVGGRIQRIQLPLSWVGVIFATVAMTAFAVSIENGRSAWQASNDALIAAFLAVAVVVVLDAVVGRRGVRIVVHVVSGLFVLFIAFLLTALQFADRFLTPPMYVVLVGFWVVGFSLIGGGVFVARDATHRVRRVAYVGLGTTLVLGLVTIGYAVGVIISRGWMVASGVTAGAVSGWLLLLALVGVPSLIFLWDLRETRPKGQNQVDEG